MRRLTKQDISNIIGTTIKGYRVVAAKVQRMPCADSDNYGIVLGRNAQNQYVTWEFHLLKDDSIFVYWAHYIMEQEEALRDFRARGSDSPQWFDVTVTETLELVVRVEARSPEEAERSVSKDWRTKEFVLGPEHFSSVGFKAELADESGKLP